MEDIIISVAQRTLIAGTPLLLGTLGEVICERSGILNLGVEGVMAIGAVFGALNTMYSAVAARAREIATMRALGFGGGSVILSSCSSHCLSP